MIANHQPTSGFQYRANQQCLDCSALWVPPTPVWAAVVFLVLTSLAFLVLGGGACFLSFLVITGILEFAYGPIIGFVGLAGVIATGCGWVIQAGRLFGADAKRVQFISGLTGQEGKATSNKSAGDDAQ